MNDNSMTSLFDFLKNTKKDYDTYDPDFECCVTVCYIESEEDSHEKFCNGIFKKVTVIEERGPSQLVVNWSEFIKRNVDKFRSFSETNWKNIYEDEDEFIDQWMKEIHYYMAGYVSDKFYKTLEEFVETLS